MAASSISCPICFELPEAEIYQCVNGHIVCAACSADLKLCPQCREEYGPTKIRARVLEDLIGGQEVDCPYKPSGCGAKVPRRDLPQHVTRCRFGGVNVQLCQYLGYPCSHTSNSRTTQDTIQHLVTVHGAWEREASSGTIELVNFMDTNFGSTSLWTPYICGNAKFLVFAKNVGGSAGISVNCVSLGESSAPEEENCLVQFQIWKDEALPLHKCPFTPFQTHFLSWENPPIKFSDVSSGTFPPVVQIEARVLKPGYLVNGSLMLHFSVQPGTPEKMVHRLPLNSKSVWVACNNQGEDAAATSTPAATPESTHVYVWTVKDFYAVQRSRKKFSIAFGPETKYPSKWEVGLKLLWDKGQGWGYIGFYCELLKTRQKNQIIKGKVKLHAVSSAGVEVEFDTLRAPFWAKRFVGTCQRNPIWQFFQPRSSWHVVQPDGSVHFIITFTVESVGSR